MNIEIDCLLHFEGTQDHLSSLLADISDVLITSGYANPQGEDERMQSLITVHHLEQSNKQVEEINKKINEAFIIIVPTVEGEKVEVNGD